MAFSVFLPSFLWHFPGLFSHDPSLEERTCWKHMGVSENVVPCGKHTKS